MLFYFTLFLSFLYFKIARVHNKEEKSNLFILLQHFVATLAIAALLVYGYFNVAWYFLILAMFAFLIMASLLITTIQLGIFIDGKPLLGLQKIYTLLPLMTLGIVILSSANWLI